MKTLERVVSPLFQSAISDGLFSGACLLVGVGRLQVFSGSWGVTSFRPEAEPVSPRSLFDLASLTKPIATATLFMIFVSQGRIHLHDPLSRFFPQHLVPDDKRTVTVAHLLAHRSGLPDYRPYFRQLIRVAPERRKEILMGWILREPLVHQPGAVRLYSDLGYILLGWILEEISGMPLDRLFAEQFPHPEKPWRLAYRRLVASAETESPIWGAPWALETQRECVATEQCPWRQRLLQGEVHDENAFSLQGVAGHAGLFGCIEELWRWARCLLELYRGGHCERLAAVTPETARVFMEGEESQRRSLADRWSLGFDRPSTQGSSAGRFFSPNTVGHLGFTGTSFWMDLDREIAIILLTNRVHPRRDDDRIREFRPLVHDKVMEVVLSSPYPFSGSHKGGFR